MKNKYSNRTLLICMLLPVLLMTSCKKFIEVESPVTSVNAGNVYVNNSTAISVLTAIYAEMSNNTLGGVSMTSLSLLPELSGDNLVLNDLAASFRAYYQNDLSATLSDRTPPYWSWCYPFIYTTNTAIEEINKSASLTPAVKNQLLGEAHFMRAFFYFYLVNLYGDVPLILTTDYKVNAIMPRTAKSMVYEQIISDLKTAQDFLNEDYVDVTLLKPSTERIRPNKAAATALLARAYLFNGDFANAEIQSNSLIENNSNYELIDLSNVFLKNSKETIWSLQPVIANFNTWEANQFTLPSTGPDYYFPFSLSDQLVASFENEDQRLNIWTGNVTTGGKNYYYAAKYKALQSTDPVTEYTMVLRLSEQYLIRAEARAQQEKLVGANSASDDINAIRTRAGLPPTTATTKQDLLDAILKERQTELFTEWGHRWFDLKRTEKIDEVMTSIIATKGQGATWESYKALYPIPQREINFNPGMKGQQNPGY